MRLFPDIEAMTTSLNESWGNGQTRRDGPDIDASWTRFDPFDVMEAYWIHASRYGSHAECRVSFDGRASVPMERLTRDFRLRRRPVRPLLSDDFPSKSKLETFSAVVAGREVLMQLDMRNDGSSGSIAIMTGR